MSLAYLGVTAKWGAEINNQIYDAQELLNTELAKGCPDSEYEEDLRKYIKVLEEAKVLNAWEALKYAFGVAEPVSNFPSLPTPPNKPNLPSVPH